MSCRFDVDSKRENRKNGNQESSSKEASEEGSKKGSKEEVSIQRNRQHNRGTPKASPDVFLGTAKSLVFMRLPQPSPRAGKLPASLPCGRKAGGHMLTKVVFRHDTFRGQVTL